MGAVNDCESGHPVTADDRDFGLSRFTTAHRHHRCDLFVEGLATVVRQRPENATRGSTRLSPSLTGKQLRGYAWTRDQVQQTKKPSHINQRVFNRL